MSIYDKPMNVFEMCKELTRLADEINEIIGQQKPQQNVLRELEGRVAVAEAEAWAARKRLWQVSAN